MPAEFVNLTGEIAVEAATQDDWLRLQNIKPGTKALLKNIDEGDMPRAKLRLFAKKIWGLKLFHELLPVAGLLAVAVDHGRFQLASMLGAVHQSDPLHPASFEVDGSRGQTW